MENMFEILKKHLSRKRVDEVTIISETEDKFDFTVKNVAFEKEFSVRYFPPGSNIPGLHRPRWHHYELHFYQDVVPCGKHLVGFERFDWCVDEEDVWQKVQHYCRIYRR